MGVFDSKTQVDASQTDARAAAADFARAITQPVKNAFGERLAFNLPVGKNARVRDVVLNVEDTSDEAIKLITGLGQRSLDAAADALAFGADAIALTRPTEEKTLKLLLIVAGVAAVAIAWAAGRAGK